MKKIKLKKNEQGNRYGTFLDLRSNRCGIAESRLPDKPILVLGTNNTGNSAPMYLDQEQVKVLLPLLVKFAESGKLR